MVEEERYYRDQEILKFIIIIFVFLAVLTFVYFILFYTRECENRDCFSNALLKCNKAVWVNDVEEATWAYTIKGISEESCEVEVKLLVVKKGGVEMESVQGESMTCYIPLNTFISPEQDLGRCNGVLKEKLQEMLIKRLHSYILENLGEIGEELTKVV